MFGKKKGKQKSVELTEEEKQKLIRRYGTCDRESIIKMQDFLYGKKQRERLDFYVAKHKDSPDFNFLRSYHLIRTNIKFIEIEKIILKKYGREPVSNLQKIFFEMDKTILANSFEKKGYSKQDAKILSEKIYNFEDVKKLKSIDAEDYEIDKDMNIRPLLEKERYDRIVNGEELSK